MWKCGACRRQFSVLVGTMFEGTRVPLAVWAAAVAAWASQSPSPSAGELSRRLGVTPETARLMTHRLAAAAEQVTPVEGDDAWLASLLAVDAATAATIRRGTPSRRRPWRQFGPTADYGRE